MKITTTRREMSLQEGLQKLSEGKVYALRFYYHGEACTAEAVEDGRFLVKSQNSGKTYNLSKASIGYVMERASSVAIYTVK